MEKNDIISKVRRRFDHEARKKALAEKYEAKMLFPAFGGMWKAGPELLTTCALWGASREAEAVLIDEYGNPKKVIVGELFDMAKKRWQEQMNGWLNEYTKTSGER